MKIQKISRVILLLSPQNQMTKSTNYLQIDHNQKFFTSLHFMFFHTFDKIIKKNLINQNIFRLINKFPFI